MKNIFVVLALALSFSMSVSAESSGGGSVVGNGGDAFQCENDKVVFFDIFEAQKGRGLTIDMGSPELDHFDKVDYVIDRIPDSLLVFKQNLRAGVILFRERSRFDDFNLEDIKDTDNVITMPGCKLVQAVVQQTPVLDSDPIFFVDKKLWEKMDNDSKASLILHEIIYWYAIRNGATNSVGTRALNSYMMASALPQEPTCFFVRALQTLRMQSLIPAVRVGNVVFDGMLSPVDNLCRVSKVKILSGSFIVEGVEIEPITVQSEEFSGEWGADLFDLTMPTFANWIQFNTQYPMQIGPHAVVLAAERSAKDWSTTSHWNWGSAPGRPATKRPGYVSVNHHGEVVAAGVESLKTQIMGQTLEIRGDVWFAGGSREILRVDYAGTGKIVINGEKLQIDGFEFHRDQNHYIVKLHGVDKNLIVEVDGSVGPSLPY